MSKKILRFWKKYVEGETPFDEVELVCVGNTKYGKVELCVKAGMYVPFAHIKLYDSNLAVDADASFETAYEFGKAIEDAWNDQKNGWENEFNQVVKINKENNIEFEKLKSENEALNKKLNKLFDDFNNLKIEGESDENG